MNKEFKLIVAGGRDFADRRTMQIKFMELVDELDAKGFDVSVVSGMARGADRLAYEMSKELGAQCYEFPADWDTYGKRAGYLRNEAMADFADGLLAFWDGESRGTQHMISIAQEAGMPVRIVNY